MSTSGNTTGSEELDRIAERLAVDFAHVAGVETVEELVKTSHDLLAGRVESAEATTLEQARDDTERFARDRLLALAKRQGKLERPWPAVLFLCVRNAGRSQMASGWFRHFAADRAVAWSGGSEPGSALDPNAVAAMAEVGIDISDGYPKPWTDEIVRGSDLVVTMGCGDACPVVPGQRYEDWALADPAGRPIEEVRTIRDEIGRRVRDLLDRLGVGEIDAKKT
jgi:arsenate reductase